MSTRVPHRCKSGHSPEYGVWGFGERGPLGFAVVAFKGLCWVLIISTCIWNLCLEPSWDLEPCKCSWVLTQSNLGFFWFLPLSSSLGSCVFWFLGKEGKVKRTSCHLPLRSDDLGVECQLFESPAKATQKTEKT